jgi:hypothetical protein
LLFLILIFFILKTAVSKLFKLVFFILFAAHLTACFWHFCIYSNLYLKYEFFLNNKDAEYELNNLGYETTWLGELKYDNLWY